MPKYVITLESDDVEVSCEAASKEEALSHVDDLVEIQKAVLEKLKQKPKAGVSRRRGRSEAVEVLRVLEEQLIPSSFFSQPRSTGEVREKVAELVNVKFQSRKVSQALGILHQKNILARVGLRGDYKYYLKKK
ncbi:MAG: hypothetical protein NZ570_04520 [Candidatus Caldarchaeum sp.]|nr:hypothetical protein [Candidatus Caldarchaeum sp.]MCS7138346.1 hypothetical protein [Candidatus Caldarchaeum sp.]MDW7978895.1 hypothetical protein [Candidatus Caldarchaeum sp.]MDW8359215.1 hypothetical protein [Candidatus Caldarchaeum sp.]